MTRVWQSPRTGRALVADTPHSLAAPGERWPVVDGIPYLRTDSEGLVAVALDHLDAGCPDDALVALLTDQDAWWTGPATDLSELKRLVRERDTLTLRAAMALLRMGPVADYFAYRWSDPTYLAGLALLAAYDTAPATAFELACGIGHYLRDLTRCGTACLGADVVFAKCWLAKHWIAPAADYVVFDAAAPWPIATQRFDLVMCHDAFYFLPDQPRVAGRLRGAVAPGGTLAISHLHNVGVAGGAKGPARPAAEWRDLFPAARVHDERALVDALMTRGVPPETSWRDDPAIEAWSLVEGAGAACAIDGGLALPPPGATLRRNPLLGDDGQVRWPSPRYRDEYAAGCRFARPGGAEDDIRVRRVVDLPERW
ncbi:SAM-dependent methyltransferase [Sphingomonas sp. BE138]|uniref:class I SAM-dependent methyltransferase n=1 Tax=Sphingomonas sp. BE138 TaxID=2817845 RepID=UPI00285E73AA|nr:methyltransferase domain-containing protein [Sphingomonas sp. BE138]MDR6787702.1 SAM-dependent methyltransferase [Sphingomonas sp. BE138]